MHDGLYVRLGLGFAGFTDTVLSDTQVNGQARDEGTVTSFATVSELAVGGTLGHGFILGGGVYSATALAPSFEQVRGQAIPAELRRPDSLSIIGVMADWYFDPRGGFHAQGALGFATLSGIGPDAPRFNDRRAAVGSGGMLGVGYEWWAGDEWGIGILGRLTGGVTAERDDNNQRWFHLTATTPSILFSATYN